MRHTVRVCLSPVVSAAQHGKAKAISILAARLARTAWLMLKRKEAFDATKFLK